MTDNYKKALNDAREELVNLLGQKEEIDKRVAQLRQTVDGLAALCGEEPKSVQPNFLQSEIIRAYENILESITGKPGLTDAIRAALKAFGRPMTPIEVRDGLISLGYDLSVYSNVLASIHTALKRLHESREITKRTDREGKVSYQWDKSPAPQWGHMIAEAMVKEEERDIQKAKERRGENPVLDPFVGQGSAPTMADIIVTNPPYATTKAEFPQMQRVKEGGYVVPQKDQKKKKEGRKPVIPDGPGNRDVSVLDQRKKKE